MGDFKVGDLVRFNLLLRDRADYGGGKRGVVVAVNGNYLRVDFAPWRIAKYWYHVEEIAHIPALEQLAKASDDGE